MLAVDSLPSLDYLIVEESSDGLGGVAADILQQAACANAEVLNQLFTLLFDRCSDAVGISPGASGFINAFNTPTR